MIRTKLVSSLEKLANPMIQRFEDILEAYEKFATMEW